MRPDLSPAEDEAPASASRTGAALAVFLCAVVLLALPAVVASGVPAGLVGRLAAWTAGLLAVAGAMKLAAVVWGLLARLFDRPRRAAVAAQID